VEEGDGELSRDEDELIKVSGDTKGILNALAMIRFLGEIGRKSKTYRNSPQIVH